jgi:hypothetical protein
MKFKNLAVSSALVAAALAFAPSAQAATFNVGAPNFQITTGTPFSQSITAIFFNGFDSATDFDDTYEFTIPQNGVGSGSISTSFSSDLNKLVITGLFINGKSYDLMTDDAGQSATVGNIPIVSGILNTIRITGTTLTSGSYSGTATFTAAVPEIGTWAMMMFGMAAIGMTMRRQKIAVSFA